MRISFSDFETDTSAIASIIYGENPHYTSSRGVVLMPEIAEELQRFLLQFNAFVQTTKTPYYRIDAYFDWETLWILEINASFVDGWGTALNLARANNIPVDKEKLLFPKRFASMGRAYLPELELLLKELAILGFEGNSICAPRENGTYPIYVYGRVGSKDMPHILPYDGLWLDNKIHLGLFSREWKGEGVKIPKHYVNRFDLWEEIPKETVLKFCDKGSPECERSSHSVIFGKPSGKAPFLKRCYREEKLIAQDVVQPMKQHGNNCQLIILAIGSEPITGYVQYGRGRIINDNSTHGPLKIG